MQATVKAAPAPDLSLRGGRRPTWQSRSTRPDHRKAIGENAAAFPRLPRRFAPRNDTSGSAVVHQRPPTVELPCTGRSLSAATVKFDSDCVRRHSVYIGSAFPRLPRRFAPRNDKSGGIVRSAKPLYNLPARKALTERRYRRNRFSRFYRQPVRIGSIAPGGVCPSPTIIYDFPYSLSYGCISRNSPGVRPVSLRNALAKAVEDGKPHSAEMCRTVSSVPRSRTLAFASRRRTMRA